MNHFTIAAAQIRAEKGNIRANIDRHFDFIAAAYRESASLIVFPELSLTGYEPELANTLSLGTDDTEILRPLIHASVQAKMVILAGCPIRSNSSKPYIGTFVFKPNGEIDVYRKRFLHPGEEEFFIESDDCYTIKVEQEKVGVAICADINNPLHAKSAYGAGSTIYAAGVFMTPNGIGEAFSNLCHYSSEFRMVSVMSNYSGNSGGYQSAGESCIIDHTGRVIVSAKDNGECLLSLRKEGNHYEGKLISSNCFID